MLNNNFTFSKQKTSITTCWSLLVNPPKPAHGQFKGRECTGVRGERAKQAWHKSSVESFEAICPIHMLEATGDGRERWILDVWLGHDFVFHHI